MQNLYKLDRALIAPQFKDSTQYPSLPKKYTVKGHVSTNDNLRKQFKIVTKKSSRTRVNLDEEQLEQFANGELHQSIFALRTHVTSDTVLHLQGYWCKVYQHGQIISAQLRN